MIAKLKQKNCYLINTLSAVVNAFVKVIRAIDVTAGFWLIRSVIAVGCAITVPNLRNAYTGFLTLELLF